MTTEMERERQRMVSGWHTLFKKGTDFDLWGQPVEAISEYQRYKMNGFSCIHSATLPKLQNGASLDFGCLAGLSRIGFDILQKFNS